MKRDPPFPPSEDVEISLMEQEHFYELSYQLSPLPFSIGLHIQLFGEVDSHKHLLLFYHRLPTHRTGASVSPSTPWLRQVKGF